MTPDYYNFCANNFSGNPPPNYASIPHNCFGYQFPCTGNSYAGIGLYALSNPSDSFDLTMELAVIKLKSTLKANTCYYGEMHYSYSNINNMSINQLGMLFTQNANTLNPFSFDNTSKYQIQADTTIFLNDTINWTKIAGAFIAQGGEEYLIIGNISDGAHLKRKFISNNYLKCGDVKKKNGYISLIR